MAGPPGVRSAGRDTFAARTPYSHRLGLADQIDRAGDVDFGAGGTGGDRDLHPLYSHRLGLADQVDRVGDVDFGEAGTLSLAFDVVWYYLVSMRISDRGMTVELDDDDPRANRIRALLFEQPGAGEPIATLWGECSNDHREVLVAIAGAGEITQADLETRLGLNGVELRGRHGGLAKIAKRLGVEYPIHSAGTHRDARRFSLAPDVAQQVLRLDSKSTKPKRKP